LYLNFALTFACRKIREKQEGFEVNGTHPLLVYADNFNIAGETSYTIKKKEQTLLQASRDVGLEVKAEKTKNMIVSRHQNAIQNHLLIAISHDSSVGIALGYGLDDRGYGL
jgi:hypothetical protein